MKTSRGLKTEAAMKRRFNGVDNPHNCVDFQTRKFFYEVKSCELFRWEAATISKKRTSTIRCGRFNVILRNHFELQGEAKKQNKIARYIFVVKIGKQRIVRVHSWKFVDGLLRSTGRTNKVRIYDILKWEAL